MCCGSWRACCFKFRHPFCASCGCCCKISHLGFGSSDEWEATVVGGLECRADSGAFSKLWGCLLFVFGCGSCASLFVYILLVVLFVIAVLTGCSRGSLHCS